MRDVDVSDNDASPAHFNRALVRRRRDVRNPHRRRTARTRIADDAHVVDVDDDALDVRPRTHAHVVSRARIRERRAHARVRPTVADHERPRRRRRRHGRLGAVCARDARVRDAHRGDERRATRHRPCVSGIGFARRRRARARRGARTARTRDKDENTRAHARRRRDSHRAASCDARKDD